MVKHRKVSLVGLNPRAINIIEKYNNGLLMQEYDSMGRPLCLTPNGSQGIFCVSPDGFWNGWFVLDVDVRFTSEDKQINDIIEDIRDS